jgi:alcohol dehydrogenase class IV
MLPRFLSIIHTGFPLTGSGKTLICPADCAHASSPWKTSLVAEIEGSPSHGSAKDFSLHLQDLIEELDLPSRPSDLGIKEEDARSVLEKTLIQTRRIVTNPRPLEEELLRYIGEGI